VPAEKRVKSTDEPLSVSQHNSSGSRVPSRACDLAGFPIDEPDRTRARWILLPDHGGFRQVRAWLHAQTRRRKRRPLDWSEADAGDETSKTGLPR
jgi:hypothetical protein